LLRGHVAGGHSKRAGGRSPQRHDHIARP
jgi:hypothetical protein